MGVYFFLAPRYAQILYHISLSLSPDTSTSTSHPGEVKVGFPPGKVYPITFAIFLNKVPSSSQSGGMARREERGRNVFGKQITENMHSPVQCGKPHGMISQYQTIRYSSDINPSIPRPKGDICAPPHSKHS
ncbi:hypothetical protein B9Z19DRAFT_695001 [Tuber borchii]|uniref:Uncharacterized protein n=1 Tax=Tuber borchii TaxID=42251 RepID=A0A2T6ZA12_TUBBO|nr:hypothetical protein B9Z19DRAFT_695001 [Tuber borchii]